MPSPPERVQQRRRLSPGNGDSGDSLSESHPTPDNQGAIRTVSGTVPAAGAEIADTVPVNTRWRLYAIEVVLVAAAVAVSRSIILIIDDSGSTVSRRLILKDTTVE